MCTDANRLTQAGCNVCGVEIGGWQFPALAAAHPDLKKHKMMAYQETDASKLQCGYPAGTGGRGGGVGGGVQQLLLCSDCCLSRSAGWQRVD